MRIQAGKGGLTQVNAACCMIAGLHSLSQRLQRSDRYGTWHLAHRDTVRQLLNLQSSRKMPNAAVRLPRKPLTHRIWAVSSNSRELFTESTWIDSVRSYQQALDNFKRQLGIHWSAHRPGRHELKHSDS